MKRLYIYFSLYFYCRLSFILFTVIYQINDKQQRPTINLNLQI